MKPESSIAALPLLDDVHLAELLELMECDFAAFVSDFLLHTEEQLSELHAFSDRQVSIERTPEKEQDVLIRIHSLKGSCRNMGTTQLSALLELLETRTKKEGLNLALANYDLITKVYSDTEKALNQYLAHLGLA